MGTGAVGVGVESAGVGFVGSGGGRGAGRGLSFGSGALVAWPGGCVVGRLGLWSVDNWRQVGRGGGQCPRLRRRSPRWRLFSGAGHGLCCRTRPMLPDTAYAGHGLCPPDTAYAPRTRPMPPDTAYAAGHSLCRTRPMPSNTRMKVRSRPQHTIDQLWRSGFSMSANPPDQAFRCFAEIEHGRRKE